MDEPAEHIGTDHQQARRPSGSTRCERARAKVVCAVSAVALASLIAEGCSSGTTYSSSATGVRRPASTGDPAGGASPRPAASGLGRRGDPNGRIRLDQIGTMDQPVAMANRPGYRILYVAEQAGRVRTVRLRDGGGTASIDQAVLLDITGEVDGQG